MTRVVCALAAPSTRRPVFGRELSKAASSSSSSGGAERAVPSAQQVAKSARRLHAAGNGERPGGPHKMLYTSLPYDPETDFAPISLVSDVPMLFMVNPRSPVQNLKDFVAQAKQKE